MDLILEMICPECSEGNCISHRNSTHVKDTVLDIIIEVRCVCKDC